MKYLILFLTILSISPLKAQRQTVEFGTITDEEIRMTSYSKDPAAKAVILFDAGRSFFYDHEGGYEIRFTRIKRIKIFDPNERSETEVQIPYYVDGYGRTEEVKDIEAYTYNFEGGFMNKKKVFNSSIFDEDVTDRWKRKKFVFPDVRSGSILELRYTIETPFYFNLPDWTFQAAVPTLYSEYQVSMIPFYEYAFLAQGVSKFDYQKSEVSKEKRTWGTVSLNYGQNVGSGVEFQDYVHTYALKDVPAFKDESYISSVNDYIAKIDFQLARYNSPSGTKKEVITTWPQLVKDLLKSEQFGKYQKNFRKYTKKIIEELDLHGKTERQKSALLTNYVKQNYSWNGYFGKYTSKSPKNFLNQKSGNVAEVNLFLASLLQEAGLQAYPVILSSRGHGKIRADYPFAEFFNYVIVLVEGKKTFLADATESSLPHNRIPPRCINDDGLVISDGELRWLKLDKTIPSLESNRITIHVSEESDEAEVAVTQQLTEYEAYNMRRKTMNDSEKISESFSNDQLSIESSSTFNHEKTTRPFIINLKGTSPVEIIGNNLVVTPFLGLSLSSNELTQDKRAYPVDFIYSRKKEYDVTIDIPKGYSVSLPKGLDFEDELVAMKLDYTQANSFVQIKGKYEFKKSIYSSQEYSRIKSHIGEIIKKFNEEIVFSKL